MAALSSPVASRRAWLGGGLAVVAAGAAGRQARAARPGELVEAPPAALPDFTFQAADGQVRRVADYAGQGLLINLWATWCAPCVIEMPALDRTQAALAADRIAVLALSSDRGGRAVVETFYQQRGIQRLEVLLDPRGAAARALGVRGLPTTVVVDREGRERARVEGDAAWDAPEMLAALRRLVGPLPGRPTTEPA